MKIDASKLYVACPVCDCGREIELYIHYESFGKIEHNIIINPKRILILKDSDAIID